MREIKNNNKIAILGGGYSGLTIAYYLSKHAKTTTYEAKLLFGGLASGFKEKRWDWFLEYAYHHIFATDKDMLSIAKEIEFNKFSFYSPETATLLNNKGENNIYRMDSPIDYLSNPSISISSRLRSAMILGWLKTTPFLPYYNKVTSESFLSKTMGEESWRGLWEQLFRKKFGKYAGNILTSFFWARIHARTSKLGYPNGGFQQFTEHLCSKIRESGGELFSSCPVLSIEKKGDGFLLTTKEHREEYSHVIITIPTQIFLKINKGVTPEKYNKSLSKLKYLSAISLISRSRTKLLPKTYWLNIGARDVPLMGIIQHTNMVDKKHYNDEEIVYIPFYLEQNDNRLKMNEFEFANHVSPYIKKINPSFNITKTRLSLFKESYAQPIYDKYFVQNMPTFITPTKNLFIANLDMTYPYDRGTNYAVQIGKSAVKEVLKSL